MNAHRYRLATTLLWVLALPWLLFPAAVPFLPALALVLLLVARLSAQRWYGYRLRATFLDGLWLVYLALTLLAYAVSPLPERSLPKLTVALAGLFGYYLAQDWLHTVRDLRRLAGLLAAAGLGLACLALFVVEWPAGGAQLLNLDFLYQHLPAWGQVHRNEMAGMLLLLLPFTYAGVQRAAPGRVRRLTAAGVLLVLAVILLTQSRAAVLALVVMALLAVGWRRPAGRLLAAVGVIALLAILLLALWPAGSLDGLAATIAQLDGSTKSGPAVSWLARLDLWQAAGQMLGDYPVMGAGLDAFYPVARSNYVLDNLDLDQDLSHAHNLFLQGGANMGWPGLLLLLLLWATVLAGLYRAGQAVPAGEVAWWARLWSVSVAGFLAFNLVDVITLGHRPALLLWLVLAGVAALARLGDQPFQVPRPVVLAAPALLLLLALPFLPRNLANLRLDRYVLRGDDALPAVEAFTGDARRQGLVVFYGGADEQALSYWQQDPQGAQFAQDRGFVAHRAGQLIAAQRLYTLALALDGDNARTLYWRGLVAAGLADLPAAASDLEQATRLAGAQADPEWLALLHYHWGRVLAEQGDLPAAHPHLQRAVSLDNAQPRYADLLNEVVSGLEQPAGLERTP